MEKFYRLCGDEKQPYWVEDKGRPFEIAGRKFFVHVSSQYQWDYSIDAEIKVFWFDFTDARTGYYFGIYLHIKDGIEKIASFVKNNQDLLEWKEKEHELSPLYNNNCKYPIKKAGDIE